MKPVPIRSLVLALATLALAVIASACATVAPAQPTAAPVKPTAAPAQPTAAPNPTAAPAQPAAAAPQVSNKLFLAADIVQGTKNLPQDQAAAKTCVVSSRYPRNAEILWRVKVVDPRTGNPMDDKALKSLQVQLADGKTTIDGKYGKHGDESFWTAVWDIPKDYPSGTVNYTVVATANDGRTGEYKPFNVAPSLLTITSDVLPDVAAPTPAKKS